MYTDNYNRQYIGAHSFKPFGGKMKNKIYDATDYGVHPGVGDCAKELQLLFDSITDGSCVVFKTGSYRLSRLVTVKGKKNIKICGNFSEIITHFDPCGPKSATNEAFKFIDCSDIEIIGFFFDTDSPIGAAGEVIAIDFENKTADVKIYDEFPVTGYEHICGTNSFDSEGSPDYALATYNDRIEEQSFTLPDGTVSRRYQGLDYEVVSDRVIRLRLNGILPEKEDCRLKIGHKINIRHEMYGHSLLSFYFCHRVTLKNITVYSAASFAVTVEPRSSDFTFDNFSIRVNKGSKRLMAINADGIHILGLMGKLVLKNCNLESMGDDTLNIHGLALEVIKIENGGEIITVDGMEGRPKKAIYECTWAQPGDKIAAYDRKSFLQIAEFTVKSVSPDGVFMTENISGELKTGCVLANKAFFAAVHIDGCTMRNTRARGALIQTQNVLVENSYIYGMSYAGLLFSPDIKRWWEVAPAENVEIRNNIFEHCAHASGTMPDGAVSFKASHEGKSTEYPAGVHKNISIYGNRFKNFSGCGIFVSAAENVRIENNIFERRKDAAETGFDIRLVNCRNTKINNNKDDDFPEKLIFTE